MSVCGVVHANCDVRTNCSSAAAEEWLGDDKLTIQMIAVNEPVVFSALQMSEMQSRRRHSLSG
jgi:hypothetical protein